MSFTVDPSSGPLGATLVPAVEVTVVDAAGQRIAGATDEITVAIEPNAEGAQLLGTVIVSAVDGVARFTDLEVDRPGVGLRLRATAAGLDPDVSDPFDIAEAAALVFTLDPPGFTAVRAPFAVEVTVVDLAGQRVVGATNSVTVALASNPVGAQLLGSRVANAVDGVARLGDLRVDRAGTFTLRASSGSLATDDSTSFEIVVVVDTAIRVDRFDAARRRVPIGASVRLDFAFSGGQPTDVLLEPGSIDLTGQSSVDVVPFPETPTSADPRAAFKLRATDQPIAQEQVELAHARRAGGPGQDVPRELATFPDGTSIASGFFQGQAVFGPGEAAGANQLGETTVTAVGDKDVWVGRFNEDGTLRAVTTASCTAAIFSRVCATFADGSCVIAGGFTGQATFGPGELAGPGRAGETVLPSTGMFLARFNDDLSLAWAVGAPGAGGGLVDRSYGVAACPDGSVVVTGLLDAVTTFGAGEPGETTLPSIGIFVARFASDGSLLWARHAAGPPSDAVVLSADAFGDGSSAITGFIGAGATVFGQGELPGPGREGETTLAGTGREGFVARYTADGSLAWARQTEDGTTQGQSVAFGPDGSVVATGFFSGSPTFSPGEAAGVDTDGATELVSQGRDVYVVRYTADGRLDWARRAGSSETDIGVSIDVLPDGTLAVTGIFQGDITFGPGEFPAPGQTGELQLFRAGDVDLFVARYDVDGRVTFAQGAGGSSLDEGHGVGSISDGRIALGAASRSPAVTLGAGDPNETTLATAGGDDILIARYDPENYRLVELLPGRLATARSAGGDQNETAHAASAFPDASVVVAGAFAGAATFGENDPNETLLTSLGTDDVFVARYDADGRLRWAVEGSGAGADAALAVAAAPDDGAFAAGRFSSDLTLGAGLPTQADLVSSGGTDAFLARFDRDGVLIWAVEVGAAGDDAALGVGALADGGAIVAGRFEGTVVLGAGEPNETSLVSAGAADVFVARYDRDGALVWAKRAGGAGDDEALAAATFGGGDAVVVGQLDTQAVFGPGEPGQATLDASPTGAFIARFAVEDGTLQFARRSGGGDDERATGVATLADGSAVAVGHFTGDVTLGPGELGQTTLNSAGATDLFVARVDAAGDLIWARRAGGTGLDEARAVAALFDGRIAVTGSFSGTAVFGPGQARQTSLVSAGATDTFLARFDATGLLVEATGAGGPTDDVGHGVAMPGDEGAFLVGRFTGSAVFDAGQPNETTISAGGPGDAFVARQFPSE